MLLLLHLLIAIGIRIHSDLFAVQSPAPAVIMFRTWSNVGCLLFPHSTPLRRGPRPNKGTSPPNIARIVTVIDSRFRHRDVDYCYRDSVLHSAAISYDKTMC